MSNTSNKTKAPAKGAMENTPGKLQRLTSYFENAYKELGKVSWPTKKEVKSTALAVLALVCVMSIFLGLVDLILSKVVQSILSLSI